MTDTNHIDPDFDDEDEENEEVYRQLLKNQGTLPPCPPTTVPVSSLSQRWTLCSAVEAEHILKTTVDVRPGNFIVRPSAHLNHPYSLSVLSNENTVYHFRIGQKSNKYVIGSVETIDWTKAKTFPSISALVEYYLTSRLTFQENKNTEHSFCLQLYPSVETTYL